MTQAAPLTDAERGELEFLRGKVVELEAERAELVRRTAETVAAAQHRAYWLDRWHLDLNAIMARRTADRIRALARLVRAPVRAVRTAKHRLRG